MEYLLGSSLNQIQGWTTVQESYSRALEQRPLPSSLQSEEGLEVVEGELAGLLCAGQHAVGQLQLLLLQLQDPRLHGVLAQEPEMKLKAYEQSPEVEFRLPFFGFRRCVILAVCGQIWEIFLGTYDLRSS